MFLIRYLTVHKPISSFYFSLLALIKGVIDYATVEALAFAAAGISSFFTGAEFDQTASGFGKNLTVWKTFDNTLVTIPLQEIIITLCISVLTSTVVIWVYNKKLAIVLFRRYLRLTSRSGDDGVWSTFLNSQQVHWVFVRMKDTGITYFGRIHAFSDPGAPQEIVLEDVSVYSTVERTEHLYDLKAVYLPLEFGKFSIELPEIQARQTDD